MHRWVLRTAGRLLVITLTLASGCTAATPPSPPTPRTAPTAPTRPAPTAAPPVATVAGPASPRTAVRPPARSTATTSTAATTPATSAAVPSRPVARSGPGGEPADCAAGRCYRIGPVYSLPVGVAPESSGIAASSTMPGAYFVVDDATGVDEVVAVRSNGSLLARVRVRGMSAANAEALTAGGCGDRPGRCLYVGDIGDNAARRGSITVYRLAEPALSPAPAAPMPADAWTYRYPDGPHNAEALVVDATGGLLLITKSAPDPVTGVVAPHRIYRAPAGGGMLRYVSSFTPPTPAVRRQSLFTGTVVTDAAFAGGRMLLLTYDEVVEYRAPSAAADLASFPSWPRDELPAPAMIQSEGITGQPAGCGYEVTSEEGPGGTAAGLAGVSCR